MRLFFFFNLFLWCVLFAAWLPYVSAMGATDPVSVQVGCILGLTALLLTAQGVIRWRRHRAARVSA
jgi:hypothetical protein